MSQVERKFAIELSDSELRELFEKLMTEWKHQSCYLSVIEQLVILKPYQRIIGLGRPVVPLLLEELQRCSGWWFHALRAISSENPVLPETAGKLLEITAA